MAMNKIISVKDIKKVFKTGLYSTTVLRDIDIDVMRGEFVIVLGPSGAGKSTFLNIMLGLERPTSGSVSIAGKNIYNLNDQEITDLRSKKFGVIYQQANWIKSLNVIENTAFPLIIRGVSQRKAVEEAGKKLELINMYRYAKYHPLELSGGQQQKVALARALVTDPEIIVGDEPTGNLDTESGADLMNILKALSVYQDKTIVLVTHNPLYKKYADEIMYIENGLSRERKKTGKKATEEAKIGLDLLNMKMDPEKIL